MPSHIPGGVAGGPTFFLPPPIQANDKRALCLAPTGFSYTSENDMRLTPNTPAWESTRDEWSVPPEQHLDARRFLEAYHDIFPGLENTESCYREWLAAGKPPATEFIGRHAPLPMIRAVPQLDLQARRTY
jgi:hypothetical protein